MEDPLVSKVWTISKAAEKAGLPRSTLQSAIDVGRVPCQVLGCGTRVVRMADVEHYVANRPKTGPVPA